MTTVREWKPGDVAAAEFNGDPNVAVSRYESGWVRLADPDDYIHDDSRYQGGEPRVTNARPLVVIDPENREQVERLVTAYAHQRHLINSEDVTRTDDMQAALREFADPKPPRPDEPTGLGAVVEDRDGRTWVHVGPGSSFAIWVPTALVDRIPGSYAAIDAVKVLGDGIPA